MASVVVKALGTAAFALSLSKLQIEEFWSRFTQWFSSLRVELVSTAWAKGSEAMALPNEYGGLVLPLIYLVLASLLVVSLFASIFSKDKTVRHQSFQYTHYLTAFFIGVVSGKLG